MGGKGNASEIFEIIATLIKQNPWKNFFNNYETPYYFYSVEDYDAWLLGHVIFAPDGNSVIEDQCRDLMNKIRVEVELPRRNDLDHAIL